MDGWFKVHRSLFICSIWKTPLDLRLFLWIVGNAVFSENGVRYGDVLIKRGQYLRSYRNLQEDMTYIENKKIKMPSLSTIKNAVERLVKDNRITIQTTELGTLFTIVNYTKYQERETQNEQDNLYCNKDLNNIPEHIANSMETVKEHPSNNNKKDKNVNKDKKNIYAYTSESPEYILSNKLYNLILQRDNNFPQPDFNKWAREIHLLITKDKRETNDIENVIIWSQQDSFWQNIILTTAKLRRNFNQLYLLSLNEGAKKNGTRNNGAWDNGRRINANRKDGAPKFEVLGANV